MLFSRIYGSKTRSDLIENDTIEDSAAKLGFARALQPVYTRSSYMPERRSEHTDAFPQN